MENSTKVSEIQKEVSFPRMSNNSASVCIFHFLVAVVSAFWWVSVRKACRAATSQRQCCDLVRAFILSDFPVSWQFKNWIPASVALDKNIWMNVAMILSMRSYRRLQKGSNSQQVYGPWAALSPPLKQNVQFKMLVIMASWAELGKRPTFTGFILVPTAHLWATKHKRRTHSTNYISKLHSAKASLLGK